MFGKMIDPRKHAFRRRRAPPQPKPAHTPPASEPAVPVLTVDAPTERRFNADPLPPPTPVKQEPVAVETRQRSDEYYQTKSMIFGALIEAIDLAQLARLDTESAREEIRDIVQRDHRPQKRRPLHRPSRKSCSTTSVTTFSVTAPPGATSLARDDIGRHHGEQRAQDLYRSQRQDPADQYPLPRRASS